MKIKTPLDCKDRVPMKEYQAEILMTGIIAEENNQPLPKEALEIQGYKIINLRLKIGNIPVSPWAVLFLASLCQSHPASLVMYAQVCVVLYKKYQRKIDTEDISKEFLSGFPTYEELEKCWDSQKLKKPLLSVVFAGQQTDNYLDTIEAWRVEDR